MIYFEMPLQSDFIQSLLPQKFPFVMVDKMHAFSELSITTGFTVISDNVLFDGNNFTESGIIEHMAQSVALHTGYQFYLKRQFAPVGYIGSIKEIKIGNLPKVSDKLETTVSILHEFAGVTLVDVITRCDDCVIANGQMKTVLAKQ